MGTALIAGLLETGKFQKKEISASDVSAERRLHVSRSYGIKCFSSNKETVRNSDILIIAVEPKHVKEVLEDISDTITNQVVISIAAGIPIVFLKKYLKKQIPLFRAMPNSPCLVGEGAIALASQKGVSENEVKLVEEIFASVGKVFVLDEHLFDAVTGLSGSGPAYIYLVMDGLIEGGVRAGLSEDLALILVAQTVLGAGKMVIETKIHPNSVVQILKNDFLHY